MKFRGKKLCIRRTQNSVKHVTVSENCVRIKMQTQNKWISLTEVQEVGGNMLSFINEHEYIMITECIHENVCILLLVVADLSNQ